MAEKKYNKKLMKLKEETKDVDKRCDDEIDELTKIFYMFFVSNSNQMTNELGIDPLKSKKH